MSKTSLQTMGLFLALAALVATVPFMWSHKGGSGRDANRAGLAVGETMPVVSGDGWVNGDGPTGDELAGKVVVVNAWRVNCPWCHKGMPELVQLHEKYKGRGVVFIGMTTHQTSEREAVEDFVKRYGSTWPNAYGAMDSMMAFKAEYIPGYWVVDRSGKVIWNKALAAEESIDDAIERALAL